MAKNSANNFQAGLYTALTGISGLGAAVYDFVPQNAAYPYVRIGLDTIADDSTKAERGQILTARLHIWDRAAGAKSIKAIMDKIYETLHMNESALTVSSFELVNIFCTYQTFMLESNHDGGDKYYHGVMDFQAQLFEV